MKPATQAPAAATPRAFLLPRRVHMLMLRADTFLHITRHAAHEFAPD